MLTPKPKPEKKDRPKKKRKKPERQLLEAELDRLVSVYVRQRDGKCVTCGSTDNLTCSHFVQRNKKRTRFDLRNCNAQCASCNWKHNRWPEAYTLYMLRHYGTELVEELLELGMIAAWKWSLEELRYLKEKIEEKMAPG